MILWVCFFFLIFEPYKRPHVEISCYSLITVIKVKICVLTDSGSESLTDSTDAHCWSEVWSLKMMISVSFSMVGINAGLWSSSRRLGVELSGALSHFSLLLACKRLLWIRGFLCFIFFAHQITTTSNRNSNYQTNYPADNFPQFSCRRETGVTEKVKSGNNVWQFECWWIFLFLFA